MAAGCLDFVFSSTCATYGEHDNVVLDETEPNRIIGVLDWEMATVGDPLMDLGGTLGYWVEAGDPDFLRAAQLMPSDLPGAPTRAEAVQRRRAIMESLLAGEVEKLYRAEGKEPPITTIWGLWFLLPIIGNIIWYVRIQNAINDGATVTVPRDNTPLNNWDGVGYIVQRDGGRSHIISGGVAETDAEIIEGGAGTAADKVAALQRVGVSVAKHPEEIPDLL